MADVITSVGIDVGTSTTSLIFSKIRIENKASSYTAPHIAIVAKDVFYRSDIYFTPLLSATEIDTDAVKKIVTDEYKKAGMKPSDVDTGAVIITGDTARKANANSLLEALSELSGDFVVATAGPDLESVLSARGAGTDHISDEYRTTVANIDIGGGTSNVAVFEKGELRGASCLDIGGRLVKVDKQHKVTYIFKKIEKLIADNNIDIKMGEVAKPEEVRKLCHLMAGYLAESIRIIPESDTCRYLYTNDGKGLSDRCPKIKGLTLSGGVADLYYHQPDAVDFRYDDIGLFLADEIRKHPAFKEVKIYEPVETIRATVVGAGTCATEISGSTITFADGYLPIKNIPVLRVAHEDETTPEGVEHSIKFQIPMYKPEGKLEQIAIALTGTEHRSFKALQRLAEAIVSGADEVIKSEFPLIVIVEDDIGKALGHALNVKLNHKKPVICIDGIHSASGDYVDLGVPVFGGHVLPVVVKTLIFNS